jgi:hypothetical protein
LAVARASRSRWKTLLEEAEKFLVAVGAPQRGDESVSDSILVLNAGSSSIKFSLFAGHQRPMRQDLSCKGACEGIGHRICFVAVDGEGSPSSASNCRPVLQPAKMRSPFFFAGLNGVFRGIT